MEKNIYTAPRVEIIFLDNDISLALESEPPAGPGESLGMNIPELHTNIPYGIA